MIPPQSFASYDLIYSGETGLKFILFDRWYYRLIEMGR